MTSAVTTARRAELQDRMLAGNGAQSTNVGGAERVISLLGGGLLAAYGLSRGTPFGLLTAIAGGGIAYRGFTGHCQVYETLGLTTVHQREQTSIPSGQGMKFEESVTIQRPREELFAFWRKLE